MTRKSRIGFKLWLDNEKIDSGNLSPEEFRKRLRDWERKLL